MQGLAFACCSATGVRYSLSINLETLLPPPPTYTEAEVRFEQPVGWRRAIAVALAVLGISALAIPLLLGQLPAQPAGLPVGLLTLALLIGIRSGWAGYAGSFLIWLVPNLPGFHYGTTFPAFIHAIPLLLAGMLLLALDRHVRALWRSIICLRWR
jgi:hypothetical protein